MTYDPPLVSVDRVQAILEQEDYPVAPLLERLGQLCTCPAGSRRGAGHSCISECACSAKRRPIAPPRRGPRIRGMRGMQGSHSRGHRHLSERRSEDRGGAFRPASDDRARGATGHLPPRGPQYTQRSREPSSARMIDVHDAAPLNVHTGIRAVFLARWPTARNVPGPPQPRRRSDVAGTRCQRRVGPGTKGSPP
jgi:hypothetical protein